MPKIARLHAREVLDSRGNPTVEVEVYVRDGTWGRAIVPSGASTGRAEAKELRDGDPDRYDGRGVRRAVGHVQGELAAAIHGVDVADQATIDARLIACDGTPDKSRLGANALLGVSLAVAHAAAASQRVPLFQHLNALWNRLTGQTVAPRMPLPMINLISGGLHAGGNLDFQDFLMFPQGAADVAQGLEWTVRVVRRLGGLLRAAGYEAHLLADEGGYGPRLHSNAQAAELIVQAIAAAGLTPGHDVTLALDVASSHFRVGQGYRLRSGAERTLSSAEMIELLTQMTDRYPITSIEDGLAEDDWPGWQELTARLGDRVRLVGDDLFATNPRLVQRGVDERVANAVLIKLNQIGTLWETLQTMHLARQHGYACVVSARSGETEDSTIADLAVATAAEHIKVGSIQRSERLAKYNQLLRLAEAVR